jgi:hypothetical protein|tara:strand:- start:362 stop:685 length:324 start_codon:yes stop_codon:yes gene_type:complete
VIQEASARNQTRSLIFERVRIQPFGFAVAHQYFSVLPSRLRSKRNVIQQKSRKSIATAALSPMEISQIADAAAEIGDAATTIFGCTLVGLALGFVLLRVESIVEGTD